METKKRALGRGLEQLFNNDNVDFNSFEREIVETTPRENIVEINVDELRPNPYQPRKVFSEEAIEELALSIQEHGVFQPIIVKKSIKGYEIVAGERRYRASKKLGLTKIPAIIRDFNDKEMMEISLLENLQRENLNVIEEATAYKNLITNLNITQEELSQRVGKSRSHITNLIGILRLPSSVQKNVLNNDLTMGHARILSKLEDTEKIEEISNKIITDKLSVRDVESLLNNEDFERKIKINRKENNTNSNYKYVEEKLRERLDSKVKIKDKKIEITFINDADLNRIIEIISIDEL